MVHAVWRCSADRTPHGLARDQHDQASDRRTGQQGGRRGRGVLLPALLAALLPLALGACARDPVQTPIAWWHGLQGGAIAQQRPPPPGENLPYPQLGTTPGRPVLPDALTRDRLREDLAAEREAAVRRAARNPIVVAQTTRLPAHPAARPAASPPPPATAANATLVAAEPPPPALPAAAKPLPAPAATAAAAASSPLTAAPAPASPVVSAPQPSGLALAGSTADTGVSLPTVAAAPPDPAQFEGVAALPQPTAAPPVPVYVPAAARGTQLGFAPGSDQLANASQSALHALSARRGAGAIVITGYGDASSDQPDAQLVALDLGLRRAQTVASELATLGVPVSALRIDAAAFGRGASALLVN